jgi:hypothetical protein
MLLSTNASLPVQTASGGGSGHSKSGNGNSTASEENSTNDNNNNDSDNNGNSQNNNNSTDDNVDDYGYDLYDDANPSNSTANVDLVSNDDSDWYKGSSQIAGDMLYGAMSIGGIAVAASLISRSVRNFEYSILCLSDTN